MPNALYLKAINKTNFLEENFLKFESETEESIVGHIQDIIYSELSAESDESAVSALQTTLLIVWFLQKVI